jgi:predicted phosphodiesterase
MPNQHHPFQWHITRRDVLKITGLTMAGLSLGIPLSANAKPIKPKIRFGMVTDPHYADADTKGTRHYRESLSKLTECVTFMNEQKVDFLIELGDLKDQDPSANEQNTLKYLQTIEAVFKKFKGPRYHVLGNHDMDSISKQQFLSHAKNTGITPNASYYSFDQKGLHFVVLDANYISDGSDYDRGNFSWTDANIPNTQIEWLKKDLASTTKPTIVFVHQPLDGNTKHCVKNAEQVRHILEYNKNVLAAFHGHNHVGNYSLIEGIHYYTLKAVIEGSGEENNAYAIVEVYDDRVVVTGYRKAVSTTMART